MLSSFFSFSSSCPLREEMERTLVATLASSAEWRKIALTWMQEERECSRCGAFYFECENLGQWKCFRHTRTFNSDGPGKHYGTARWDCCGREYQSFFTRSNNGCTRSDHTGIRRIDGKDIPQMDEQMVLIELIEKQIIKPPLPQSISSSRSIASPSPTPAAGGIYYIKRFDF